MQLLLCEITFLCLRDSFSVVGFACSPPLSFSLSFSFSTSLVCVIRLHACFCADYPGYYSWHLLLSALGFLPLAVCVSHLGVMALSVCNPHRWPILHATILEHCCTLLGCPSCAPQPVSVFCVPSYHICLTFCFVCSVYMISVALLVIL